jgi:hypothetical protein
MKRYEDGLIVTRCHFLPGSELPATVFPKKPEDNQYLSEIAGYILNQPGL